MRAHISRRNSLFTLTLLTAALSVACSSSSGSVLCGNSVVNAGESCDDGPANSDDWSVEPHCNSTCTGLAPHCGDEAIESGSETCDDGTDNSDAYSVTAHCNATCSGLAAYCGDGTTDTGNEQCDDGSGNSDAWAAAEHCNSTCTGPGPYCGDGLTDTGNETCDDGSANDDAWALDIHCNASCSGISPYCGDGNIDSGDETCDDGPDNNDAWTPMPHCNGTCSGQAPLCDRTEAAPIVFPRPSAMSQYPTENPHSDNKMLLGKVLFWEEQLSSDDTVACGTCHQPASGGSDPRSITARHPGPMGTPGDPSDDPHGSPGIRRCQIDMNGDVEYISDPLFGMNVQVTSRKSPSFMDAMGPDNLFLDGRATSEFVDPETGVTYIASGGALESQAVGPPVSPVEMACEDRTWTDIRIKLGDAVPLGLASDLPPDIDNFICKYPTYPELFEATFGDPSITTRRIAFAIATYERTLVSDQTPFDLFEAGNMMALTDAQIRGRDLVINSGSNANCQRCHKPNLHLSGNEIVNLGFTNSLFDTGTTGIGDFRTSTLKNVALREAGGLLHDGISGTIRDVVEDYSVPPFDGSDPSNLTAPLNLTTQEIDDIVDFLTNALTDPRAANEIYPFDRPTLSTEP